VYNSGLKTRKAAVSAGVPPTFIFAKTGSFCASPGCFKITMLSVHNGQSSDSIVDILREILTASGVVSDAFYKS
jgi:hypothetical protein